MVGVDGNGILGQEIAFSLGMIVEMVMRMRHVLYACMSSNHPRPTSYIAIRQSSV
jgi:hypothetical protein